MDQKESAAARRAPARSSVFTKYRAKVTEEILAWVRQRYGGCVAPLQARTIRTAIKEQFGTAVSLTTARRILRLGLSMSYRKIQR